MPWSSHFVSVDESWIFCCSAVSVGDSAPEPPVVDFEEPLFELPLLLLEPPAFFNLSPSPQNVIAKNRIPKESSFIDDFPSGSVVECLDIFAINLENCKIAKLERYTTRLMMSPRIEYYRSNKRSFCSHQRWITSGVSVY
jgi:hypothetical protein